MMKNISILGSTGSIGTQTLEIIRNHRDRFTVAAISGNNNIELLREQVLEFNPKLVCVYNEANASRLASLLEGLQSPPEIVSGMEGLIKVSTLAESDVVVTAVVGMVGILPTIEAIHAGKEIALANKETLVCAGHIIMAEAARCGVRILPVDSEHSAIFQSLQGQPGKSLEKIILTASGGPFRGRKREELKDITPADALKHPNWTMGAKVTIDSSTLANKGLEVMEARWLFNVNPSKIEVVVQPESILHSAVQYEDGAIIAQLGAPDMKVPIQYALFYPERPFLDGPRADFFKLGSLHFERPDLEAFPALALAYRAIEEGGSMPTVFNAANERAVADFLKGKLSYLGISQFIEKTMNSHKVIKNPGLNEIIKIGEDIIF